MKKNKTSVSDIFVKKFLSKSKTLSKTLFTKDEINKIWMQSGGTASRENYALGFLKAQGIIFRVAKDLYTTTGESGCDEIYWQIIDKLIAQYMSNGAIIVSEKALEWHLFNYMPPQKLVLYTHNLNARIQLYNGREVHFRTISTGNRTQGKNFFTILKKFSQKAKGYKNIFIPTKEIALLEALSLREQDLGYNEILVLQFLQRNHTQLDINILQEVVKYRYIRAINRLRSLTKEQKMDDLYTKTLQIIKKEGAGCFVSF